MTQKGVAAMKIRPALDEVKTIAAAGAYKVLPVSGEILSDICQLMGELDPAYLARLRSLTAKPLWQAFRAETAAGLAAAARSPADMVLLDSGAGGTGTVFNWKLLQGFPRLYILAGGLDADNAADAVTRLHPYAVDVSSGIETAGKKDPAKMAAFAAAVRGQDNEGKE